MTCKGFSKTINTFVSAVEGCKCHHEEGGGIFSSVNQMKGPFVITVTAQALDESQPSRDALDNRSHSVGVAVTNLIICKKRSFKDTASVSLRTPVVLLSVRVESLEMSAIPPQCLALRHTHGARTASRSSPESILKPFTPTSETFR